HIRLPSIPSERCEGPPLRFADARRGLRGARRDVPVIRDELLASLHAALDTAGFPVPEDGVDLSPPSRADHGDFTTAIAMRLAGSVGAPPRDVAARIVEALEAQRPPHLERVEIAGPGFLNLYLAPTWLHEVLRAVVAQGERYGHGRAL